MLKKLKYSAAILLAFTVGTTAVAQTPKGMKILGMSDFEDFDIDKDGKVSKEEIRERRGVAVQSMDQKVVSLVNDLLVADQHGPLAVREDHRTVHLAQRQPGFLLYPLASLPIHQRLSPG